MRSTRGRRIRSGVAVAGLSALLVAGCSSGGDSHSGADAGAGASAASQVERGSAPKADAGVSKSSAGAAGGRAAKADLVARADRKLVRTADLTIRVDTIRSGVSRVHTIVDDAGGYVTQEQVGGDQDLHAAPAKDYGGTAEVTLAVPADRLDATLRKLASVGTVTERSTTSDDVTKQYVDTSSRITTMQTSIDRLRRLMKDSQDLDDVTALESALTTREATLESLTSQLSSLKDQVAMSTVHLTLSTTATPAEPASESPHGFGQGVAAGWHAFVSAVAAVVTVVGILLPFLVVAVLVGLPLTIWLRRRRAALSARRAPAPAP